MSVISQRVQDLINIAGQTITFVGITKVYNKVTQENVLTRVDTVTIGFVRKYTPKELTGGLVQQVDREFKIAVDSLTVVPKKNDEIKIGTDIYHIIAVETRNAKNKDAMYVIQGRGNDN